MPGFQERIIRSSGFYGNIATPQMACWVNAHHYRVFAKEKPSRGLQIKAVINPVHSMCLRVSEVNIKSQCFCDCFFP